MVASRFYTIIEPLKRKKNETIPERLSKVILADQDHVGYFIQLTNLEPTLPWDEMLHAETVKRLYRLLWN
jgi:hypothetical protein